MVSQTDVLLFDTQSNDCKTTVVPRVVSLSDIETIPEPVVIEKIDLKPLMPVSCPAMNGNVNSSFL